MKTLEFIKAVKKLGYYPLENNEKIKIARPQSVPYVYADVATKYRNVFRTDYFPFTELTSEKQAELLDVLIEYARTPLEEREEEPKCKLRHKWLCLDEFGDEKAFLNYCAENKNVFNSSEESVEDEILTTGTQAEWKKRTGRTWAQLMNEFDVEEIE